MLNKRNSNGNFDERQVQNRNKVGNQCFFVLYYLLMIDLLLTNYGVKWAYSHISIVVIMLFSLGYYLIRIVWAGAYANVRSDDGKHVFIRLGLLAAITIIIAIAKKTNFFKERIDFSDGGFLRLLLFFFVFFTIVIVSNILSRRINNGGNE